MNKKLKFALIGVLAVVVVAVLLIILQGPAINLNKYLTLNYEGRDGYTIATHQFDYDKFQEDFSKKMGVSIDTGLIKGSLDKTEFLKNGDKVTFTWDVDADYIKETYGCTLRCGAKTITIKNRQAVEAYDPFKDVTLTYTGANSHGSVNLELTGDLRIAGCLNYEIVNKDSIQGTLTDGDKVQVKVSISDEYDETYLANTLYVSLATTEKTYTVENLGRYANKLSDISDADLAQLLKQADAAYMDYAKKEWTKQLLLHGMSYEGMYFLNKNGEGNRIILVFQIHIGGDFAETTANDLICYYTAVTFENGVISKDNQFSLESDNCTLPTNKHYYRIQTGDYAWEYDAHYVLGYKTLYTLFAQEVLAHEGEYTYETTFPTE